jgi:uncharacterized membrane protein YuzA (DUF378 family)
MPFVALVVGILFLGLVGKGASRRTYVLVGLAAAVAAFWELQQ